MEKNFYCEISPPTINSLISIVSKKYTSKPALSYVDGEGFTYQEVVVAAWKLATFLDSKKISKDAHIMLLSQSSPWWGVSYLGIVGSGRVVVPVLPDFPPEDMLHIADHSDSTHCLISARLLSKIKGAKTKLKLIGIEGFHEIPKKEEYVPLNAVDYVQSFVEEDFQNATAYFEGINPDPNKLCSIIYTSGTSGMSKGVMLSHGNICCDINSANVIPPKVEIVNTISILPLSHAYECSIGLFTVMTRGANIHYLRRNLSPATLMPALKQVKPELMTSVPILLEKIYRKQVLPKFTGTKLMRTLYGIPAFRKILNRIAGKKLYKTFGGKLVFFGIGGAGLDPVVEQFVREAKFPYAMGYGLTETAPLVVGFNFWTSRYRSTGYLLPDIDVRIDDPDEKGEGEILVRGPNVMLGYYKNDELTKEVMTGDGYFRTGDKGSLRDNYLYISGRIKNIILSANGENIYPEAIESVINQFDFVEDSMVFQDENDKKLIARVQVNHEDFKKFLSKVKEGATVGFTEVKGFLADLQRKINRKLSKSSQINVVIEQKDSFEKTPTNKIKRFKHNKISKEDLDNTIK